MQRTKKQRRLGSTILPFVLMGGLVGGRAQQPMEVSRLIGSAHLLRPGSFTPSAAATFRAGAQREQIQGSVMMHALVGKDGRVERAEIISGPLGLQFPAEQVVRTSVYAPFTRDGMPVETWVPVLVRFETGPGTDPKIYQPFLTAFSACKATVEKGEEGVASCEHSQQLSDELPPIDPPRAERTENLILLATSLLFANRPKEAVAAGQRAVHELNENGGVPRVAMSAYGIAGEAEAASGDLAGADRDLRDAEEFGHWAMRDSKATWHDWAVKRQRSLLKMHAWVLEAMHRESDAQAKLQEAAKL